jgi:uncharacterized protein (DUF2252 family)
MKEEQHFARSASGTGSADAKFPAVQTANGNRVNGNGGAIQRLLTKKRAPSVAISIGGTELLPVDELLAAGKTLRSAVPRAAHAEWKPRDQRVDPLAILRKSDAGRLQDLVPIRYGRMLESPFAYFRGSAAVMATDLAKTPVTGVRVQACGDCHLVNFGGFATPERNIVFDMNDFDETLPGPWEWDVKRLAASFLLAARSIGFSDAQGCDAVSAAARSYRKALREFTPMHPLEIWYASVTARDFFKAASKEDRPKLQDRIDRAIERAGSANDFPKLAGMVGGHIGIRDAPPLIFHPQVLRPADSLKIIDSAFAAYRQTLADERRTLLDQYRVVDAAIKVVGIGSVGRRCWVVLLMSATNEPLFLQFKEAVASVLEPYAGKSIYPHHGQRVVIGQRMTQPASDLFLGWVTASGPAGHRQFYVRQLRDTKIKPIIETFDPDFLCLYAKMCGRVLARAHAKTGDQCTISGYIGMSPDFDQAMTKFALAYADQTERDYTALKTAVRNGHVQAYRE